LLDQKLVKSGSIRKTSADASLQKCESSKAGLKAAKAGLNEITSLAVNIKEVAPFDGKVLLWLTESGENIMPGKPILSFGNKSLEVRVQVHEKDIAAGIQKGTGVIMTLASGKVIRADVRMVASMALGPGRMVEVKIPLQQKDAVNLQHGGSIDVDFILDEKAEILMVPVNAVANKGDVYGLFVEQDNKVKWVVVTPFIVENGWIAVEGNIKEGTRVVVGNLDVMQDGAWVYPVMIKED
jgi:multidrug efflux pump subunit AcrA (membrane-fusion protein)